MRDSLCVLHGKIRKETNKVNILNMIINKYKYTKTDIYLIDAFYDDDNESLLECLDCSISSEVPWVNCDLSELFDKDYDEDYIDVSLIYGSYIPYLREIIDDYSNQISKYVTNNFYNKDYIVELSNSYFVKKLLIVDNNYLSLDDYNEIVFYITENIDLKYHNFLLNEIKKYFSIN